MRARRPDQGPTDRSGRGRELGTLAVRPATGDDALAIATVHVRSWKAAYPGLVPQSYLNDLDVRRHRREWEIVLDATSWPGEGTLVLMDITGSGTETVVGFAGISPTRDGDDDPAQVGELQTLYLDPLHWGRGGGTTLLRAAQDQLGRAGFRSASAWVLETNTAARRFYERHGWHDDGTTKLHDWEAFVATDVRYRSPLT